MHGKIEIGLLLASSDLILPEIEMRSALQTWRAVFDP
jgi:hypothetical protein